MKRRKPDLVFRNVDCSRYGECLTIAALADRPFMQCESCPSKNDRRNRISVDNLTAPDVLGSAALLVEIFKDGFYEKVFTAD